MEVVKFGALAVTVFAAVIFLFGWDVDPEFKKKAAEERRAREVIGACWKEQARKSLEPSSARWVAGVCEKMEADFKAKYGREP